MQMLAQFAQSARRSYNYQRIVIARQRPNAQLVGGFGCIAVLILLVKVGFLHGGAAVATALRARTCRIGFNFGILAVVTLMMRFGDEFDLLAFTLIAEEQHLAAIGDKNKCVMWNSHEIQTPEAASGSLRQKPDAANMSFQV